MQVTKAVLTPTTIFIPPLSIIPIFRLPSIKKEKPPTLTPPEYSFSYCYSYDYVIDAFSVENIENNKPIPIVDKSSVDLKDKKRSNIVTFKFKTDNKACYRITLIMGKGLNNVICEYNYVNLNNLTLYKIGNESENLAQDFTYANGNVSWSENAAVYDRHIDA